jgi:amino acid adenylation domain-containing protein/non-ribosomal peptide synthase protein (TIGR01720 family)
MSSIELDTGSQNRCSALLQQISATVSDITGIEVAEIEPDLNLFSMGLDSIMLVRLRQAVERDYGVRISMSELNQDLSTLSAIAVHLERRLPAEQVGEIEQSESLPATGDATSILLSGSCQTQLPMSDAEELISQQLQLMSQQLALLANGDTTTAAGRQLQPTPSSERQMVVSRPAPQAKVKADQGDLQHSRLPYKQLGTQLGSAQRVHEQQQHHLDTLVESYTRNTRRSKQLTQTYRPVFANIRNIAGYRQEWKELIYQIVVDRADGSRFWDVDGREYLDMTMGFGVYLFGHNPGFIQDAVQEALAKGAPIGPMCAQAGTVAQQIHQLTGVDRVAFFNTGTEAVMAAVRLARTVTGRSKIVMFSGSYHGHTDNLLVIGHGQETIPMVPGTPFNLVQDTYVLGYDQEESLSFIEAHGDELAAVIVEPVQSRNPDLQPTQFLQRLRQLTSRIGTALIFDEVILGFRVHPGGAQAWFEVQADLVTYGKLVGGGMPIGVVAGRAAYLDAIDGGMWQYGDDSAPPRENTIVAGTFNHHPLAMAAAEAVLDRLITAGPGLQEDLNRSTAQLARRLNSIFEGVEVPIRMVHFGSLFRLDLAGEHELLNYHLINRGVYIWEGRNCFISTAHTDEDLDYLVDAVEQSISDMVAGGIFPARAKSQEAASERGESGTGEPAQYPLSSAQHRMYVLSQLDGGELGYHVPVALTVDGKLDLERLQGCYQELIQRHEVLRASFKLADGEVVQTIAPQIKVVIEQLTATEEAVDQVIESFIRPFDLSQAPLMRLAVARLGEQRHLLLFDAHHIIFDGVSGGLIFDELIRLYNGEQLPPLRKRYRDYVEQEQAYLRSDDCTRDQAYWLDTLAGERPALELPIDYPRPAQKSFSGARIFRRIGEQRTEALKALSRLTGTTLHMLLLGAHFVLLHKLTAADDIVVGTTFDGRLGEEFQNVIGMFVNTIAICARPTGTRRFSDLLEAVRRAVLEAYDHQQYPFELAVEQLGVTRDMGRNPLFDTMFVFESMGTSKLRTGELTLCERDISSRTAIFDLTHEIVDIDGGLTMSMELNTDIFETATVERLLDSYTTILDQVTVDPETPLSEINIVSESERALLLGKLTDTSADYPRDRTLADLFAEQAALTPDRTAVVDDNQSLTYAKLDSWANQIANHLIDELALPAGEIVGILLDRSAQLIAAILGVLKAGCAYLPIDPDYPRQRRQFMLQDSGCQIVLVTGDTELDLGVDKVRQVDVSSLAGADGRPDRQVDPEALAYLIYTSGSTGTPKGCPISNRNVVRLIKNGRHCFDFNQDDVWIMAHSQCFDVSVWEIFGALLYGGALVVPDKESVRDPSRLHALVRQHRVSILNQIPGAFIGFIQEELKHEGDALAAHLRYVIFAGDRLLTASLVPWCERYSPDQIELINMYGITETTVHVTFCRLTADDLTAPGSPIGAPLPETTVYILDDQQALLPIGAIGEIWVGGSGVGQGYLNRPDLTAERFVENPYRPGERLYRSGDLGRWRGQGTLEYVGRNDDQIQIRGYRVEPGEVVNHLLSHPDISQAHVAATSNHGGQPELVAYLVSHAPLTERGLRRHLGSKLPEFMLPAHFVPMTELPLTANGKVDRKRLPAPGRAALATGARYEPPRREIEQKLVDAWEAALGRTGIGVHDDFFGLGGDSIKAIQVVAGLQQQGYRLAVRDLFQAPELADLATRATRLERLVAQGPVTGKMPLTPIQTWFLNADRAQPHHYNQSVSLCSEQRLDEQALRAALGKLQAHHDVLRARLCQDEGGAVLELAGLDHTLSFDVVDLREAENPEQLIDSHANQVQAGIDLEQGPLLRAVLFRLDQGDQLLVVIHHLVVDGVSWRILIDDIALGYQQYLERGTIELPPKTDSFQAWSRQVELARQSGLFAAEEKHWQAVEAAPPEPLPSDHTGGGNLVGSSQRLSFELDREVTSDLLTRSGQAYNTTVEDLLLTALARALYRQWSRQRVTVNREGHGRDTTLADLDISRTVGWFTTLFPVALDLSGLDELGAQICRVKESLRQVPSRGFGYSLLRYAEPSSSLPKPQLIFNYLGQFDETAGQGLLRVKEGAGDPVSLVNIRDCELEVEALVSDGKLRMSLTFSTDSYLRETIDSLLSHLEQELITVLAHCLDQDHCRLTPSDLTYQGLSLSDLDQLLTEAGVEPGNLQDVFGLSPLQEGMLYHSLFDTSSHAYILQIAFSVRGELDMARFEQSWNQLVARHDALRTAFLHRGGEQPLQLVLRERQVPFYFEDISHLDQEAQVDKLQDLRQTDLEQGFDLSHDQLLRVLVLQLAPDTFEVIWSSHHILFDGWCLAGLTEELVALYQALEQGAIPDLPPPPSYATYIKWLQTIDQEAASHFWSGYLAGFERPTHLPKAGAASRGNHFRQVAFELSPEASNQLAELAAANRVTLSTVVRAVWGALLSKHTAADDVVFGVTVSGRPAELVDVEQMIGLFINTVPLRARMQADLSFTDLIRSMQEQWLTSEPHHYLSLADIQSLSAPGRDLLDHVLVFENYPHAEELRCGQSRLRSHFSIESVEVTELTSYAFVVVAYPGEQLRIELRYDSSAHSSELVEEIREQMLATFKAVSEAPEIRVGALVRSLLSEDEKQERDSFMKSVMAVDETF